MTIEKINDNQIRCTLTRSDLEEHQIKISELAYGTGSSKELFRKMMDQAQIECGFTTDNMPLMIEAIPISDESLVLIITKVEDPEELDVRFAKFAPFKHSGVGTAEKVDGADEILDLFRQLRETVSGSRRAHSDKDSTGRTSEVADEKEGPGLCRQYHFHSLDDVIAASHALRGFFQGENTLYKESGDNGYALVIHQSSTNPEDFNKVCNILSEFGAGRACSSSSEAFLQEHGQVLSDNALQSVYDLA